jgi:predicted esterase
VLNPKISPGDYHSMHFMLKNIFNDLGKLKPYETAGAIRERYLKYKEVLAELGTTGYARNQGIYRRAFISAVDSTLQPYSIKIPKHYDQSRQYPLLVMLHGSGSDDQGMLNNPLTDGHFIELAPNGRGTSNCFTTDFAQIDVKEAIQDLISNYSIDTSKIILAGFSMGGYGVYRIFYEYPNLFKGISIFSGHPNLANRWIGEGHPDFLKDQYLLPFKDIPVFIYHSKNDLNCPYELTETLVDKLKKAGAKVESVIVEKSGHGIMETDKMPIYHEWLKSVIN